MAKQKNISPASTAEVRTWALDPSNREALEAAGVPLNFLAPPSGKVRGRVPSGVYALFTEATGRPSGEHSVADAKTIPLVLTKRDKNGRSRGKVTVDVPVSEVRSLGNAPAAGRLSSAVKQAAVEALQSQRGW